MTTFRGSSLPPIGRTNTHIRCIMYRVMRRRVTPGGQMTTKLPRLSNMIQVKDLIWHSLRCQHEMIPLNLLILLSWQLAGLYCTKTWEGGRKRLRSPCNLGLIEAGMCWGLGGSCGWHIPELVAVTLDEKEIRHPDST